MQRSGQNQEVKSIGHDHEFNIESSKGKGAAGMPHWPIDM